MQLGGGKNGKACARAAGMGKARREMLVGWSTAGHESANVWSERIRTAKASEQTYPCWLVVEAVAVKGVRAAEQAYADAHDLICLSVRLERLLRKSEDERLP